MISNQMDDSNAGVVEGAVDPTQERGSVRERYWRYLNEPVDGASLAVFRMCFAACMLANLHLFGDKFATTIVQAPYHFSYLSWLPWLGAHELNLMFGAMSVLAALIGVGLFYRPACLLFTIAYTYVFLLEKCLYQNHVYLSCMVGLFLFLVPGNRVWALDNIDEKVRPEIPRWCVEIFKIQIAIVYFFAGINKLNPDWLRGQPQTAWVMRKVGDPIIGKLLAQPWFPSAVTYGGIAVDLSMGFLLFFKRTFPIAALISLSFHLMNTRLFEIDYFPWFMIATIGLFAPYDWPRKVFPFLKWKGFKNQDEVPAQKTATGLRFNTALLVFAHVFILVQLLVPTRRFFYPGEMNWTNQGHRFGWTMLGRIMGPQQFAMTITNPKTGETRTIDPTEVLTPAQFTYMATRPDMIHQFAEFVADDVEATTHVRPEVRVNIMAKLNDHPVQPLIDPTVDLAAQPDTFFNQPWILPLKR